MLDDLIRIACPLPTDEIQNIEDRMIEEISSGLDLQEAASMLLQIHPTTTQFDRPFVPEGHILSEKWFELSKGLLIGCKEWGIDILAEDHDTLLDGVFDDTQLLAQGGANTSRQGRTVPYITELAHFVIEFGKAEKIVSLARDEWVCCLQILSSLLTRYEGSMQIEPMASYLVGCRNLDYEDAKLISGFIYFNAFGPTTSSLMSELNDVIASHQTR